MDHSRIHQLDNILANQIAAGEVVERPASVVKELIENSLDVGATRIEIEVEKGGASLIRVKDNGNGIHPDDLTLALSRHATSKILTTADLSAIESLGFRGEALASISSVSRLKLISKWHRSEQALQAEAEGRDMVVTVSPAGLAEGTVVEVRELFFNTPARRRFMRTDKTEFRQIETVIARMALSHARVTFLLKHNGKKIRQFNAAEDRQDEERRVAQILGKDFLQHCVHFSIDHSVEGHPIKFTGWLGMPYYHRSLNDGQFVFVNGRPIKDPVVSHAIREAYAERLPPGRLPAYIIDITLNPETVDVNVHPTKHEVRFQHQRMVHDLITRALSEVLEQGVETISTTSEQHRPLTTGGYGSGGGGRFSGAETISEQAGVYSKLIESGLSKEPLSSLIVENNYLLLTHENRVNLISFEAFIKQWRDLWLQQSQIDTAAILFPLKIKISKQQANALMTRQPILKQLGLEILVDDSLEEFKLLSMPIFLAGVETEIFCRILIGCLNEKTATSLLKKLCDLLAEDKNLRQGYIDYHRLNNSEDAYQWFNQNHQQSNNSWFKTLTLTELDSFFTKD